MIVAVLQLGFSSCGGNFNQRNDLALCQVSESDGLKVVMRGKLVSFCSAARRVSTCVCMYVHMCVCLCLSICIASF